MLETLALPAATTPPSGDARPAGPPAAGETGQAPFQEVLAAAEATAEPEAPPPAPTDDPAALAALTALMAQLVNLAPVAAAPIQNLAEAPADQPPALVTVTLLTEPQPPAAAEDLQPVDASSRGAQPAQASQPGLPPDFAAMMNRADVAAVSPEAQQAQRVGQPATPPAGAEPAAQIIKNAPSAARADESDAQPVAPPAMTAAPQVNFEPARLAEAHSPAVAARPEIVLPQVLRGVEGLARSGATSMRLQLHPENLGRIDVQVTTNADGLRVSLTADTAATGGLLQQHLADLRHSLSESGLSLQALSVGIGQGQGGQQMTAWGRPPHAAGFMTPAHNRAAAPEPALPPEPAGASAGARVDYRI